MESKTIAMGVGLIWALAAASGLAAATLHKQLAAEPAAELAADARTQGDAARGAAVFYARVMACSTCHSVGDRPATIGPDLARLGPQLSDAYLVEAILDPSKAIAKGYSSVTIQTAAGQLITGLPVEE